MNTWKSVWPIAAALMLAGQAGAQSEPGPAQNVQEREAEVERRMYEAEERMAEAARLIAELAKERLPNVNGMQRHFRFIGDERPRLGVSIGGDQDGPVEGVAIVAVTPGSAAAEAGLRAGDVITSVNDESMSAADSETANNRLLDFMRGVEEGDTLQVEYLRDGKVGKVEVEPTPIADPMFVFSGKGPGFRMPVAPNMQVMPHGAPGTGDYFFHWTSDGLGDLELVELNAGLGKYFGTTEGLLVVSTSGTSLQLEDGDVIQKIDGRTPTSVRHALRILGSYQAGESLQLEIMRDKKRRTLDVEIPDDRSGMRLPEAPPAVRPARAVPPAPAPGAVERS